MRAPIENISLLQKKLNDLQLENQMLKNLLDQAGISYTQALKRLLAPETVEAYDPDQGARIRHPNIITEKMANTFYSWFWGRQDVYAKRSVKKSTGEAGYYPQCHNFWTNVCPRKYGQKTPCKDCPHQSHKTLTKEDILRHLQGRAPDASDVIGVYPLLPNGTCRFLVFDFDNHEGDAEKRDYANTDDDWIEEVEAMRTICILNGIDPLVERSRSGKGAHIWIFLDKPVSAALVRRFGFALLAKGAEQVNLKSFKYYDRMLPAQDVLSEGGIGNLIALPLQGRALREGNSAFIDRNRNAYPDQWAALKSKPKLSKEFLELKLAEWTQAAVFLENLGTDGDVDGSLEAAESGAATGKGVADADVVTSREKPWKAGAAFSKADCNGAMHITLSNGIYVDSLNLKPGLQNRIRRLAAFGNPVYFKNNAIGMSNYNTPRWIYLGKDHLSGYIQIPRGLYEGLIDNVTAAGIPYEVSDERQQGQPIRVSFQGELREEQKPALAEMIRHDNGILHAATAFGKTVVCSAIIAERKVNTLIILESSALIDQWKEALEKFLIIDEQLPEYKTKTGRVKTRKSLIGVLQAQHDSTTGIIDIAMAGSLCRKGEFHPRLEQYGMVIVDECHHAASDTISAVLQEVKARYVYGVTATPNRGDGLERINYMLLGPIRYKYTTKEKAKSQGIDHLVYPRFTRTVPQRGIEMERVHPNEAYEMIRNNEVRDEQILDDVRECVESGRTPVILSKYKDHSERLYERVKAYADHVFLMTGNNSKREHKRILAEMQQVDPRESMILVATGSLIGEGFDYPRLDTLIMATPVSFKGVVEQYAGRLNRDYDGKKNVVVYDYVDRHIPMFDNMYAKRLRAYKQIGYDVCGGIGVGRGDRIGEVICGGNGDELGGEIGGDGCDKLSGETGGGGGDRCRVGKQTVDSIFNSESYQPAFQKDLLEAQKNIVISSPAISGPKVYDLISLLKEPQERGVAVTVMTWEPDCYGFGDPSYWMQLHEEMRQAGFYLKLQDMYCENYAIIDQEIVWYGSVNLLAKSDAEKGIMRVPSRKIAAELMEVAWMGK